MHHPHADPKTQEGKILASLKQSGARITLDELVTACLALDYEDTFNQRPKREHLKMKTAESILYHLIGLDSLIGSEEVNP